MYEFEFPLPPINDEYDCLYCRCAVNGHKDREKDDEILFFDDFECQNAVGKWEKIPSALAEYLNEWLMSLPHEKTNEAWNHLEDVQGEPW